MNLFFANQSIGPLFRDVIRAAQSRGSVHVFSGVSYRRSSTHWRLISWFVYTIQLAWHLVWKGCRYDRLLIVSNPPLAPLLAPLSRRPYALLLYDLYPQILSQLQLKNFIQRWFVAQIIFFWHVANRRLFRRAECIFTLSNAMADELKPHFPDEGTWIKRVVVIPPWSDITNFYPASTAAQAFRDDLAITGMVITYSGNIGITHPLEHLVVAAALLEGIASSPPVQVLIIGAGTKRADLQRQASALEIPSSRLRFLQPLPYSDVAASLSAADLAVVAIDGPVAAASLPSKTFNALACGTPLLAVAPINSALGKLVLEHSCGLVIEPNPDAARQIADACIYLHAHPDELHDLAKNALAASRFYTPSNADCLVDSWLGPSNATTTLYEHLPNLGDR